MKPRSLPWLKPLLTQYVPFPRCGEAGAPLVVLYATRLVATAYGLCRLYGFRGPCPTVLNAANRWRETEGVMPQYARLAGRLCSYQANPLVLPHLPARNRVERLEIAFASDVASPCVGERSFAACAQQPGRKRFQLSTRRLDSIWSGRVSLTLAA